MTAELRVVKPHERDAGTAQTPGMHREAGPGDFVFVPPKAVHQKINADSETPIEMIVARNGQESIDVSVDVPNADEQ